MKITVNNQTLSTTLEHNSSVDALLKLLEKGPIKVDMQDYANMEKVGSLGTDLPRNDKYTTTKPGDIILYQGSLLVIYYKPNSWSFTRLGTINNISPQELTTILQKGNVTIELSL